MVKLSHKSKRIPAKRRYRIEKNIREHNRKVRKETKKKENKKNSKKKFVIPNKFPLKEEILSMTEKQKQKEIEEKKRQKLERRKERKETFKRTEEVLKPKSFDELIKQTEKRQLEFEKIQSAITNPFEIWSTKSQEEKETSLKTFYKEFKKVVESADVIIQVLDARDPAGSRCFQAEEMILASNKKLILLLNKIDLVPKENIQKWLKYLRGHYPTVAFKSSTQFQNQKLSQSNVPLNLASDNLLKSSKCLGANILLKLLNSYTRAESGYVKQTITVGVIGLPNVGKSSVINSLKRSNACMIGSMPGLTRFMQEVKLDKHIKLLDSPGIVMSKDEDSASLVLKNCIKVENVEDPLGPTELLIRRCNKEQLISRYGISSFSDATGFLNQIAKRYGKMKKNGIADLKKAAQMILNDWNNGKLTYYTLPPESNTKLLETKLVIEASPVLDIDALLKDDEKDLFEQMDDDTSLVVKGVQVDPTEPIKTDFNSLEDGRQESSSRLIRSSVILECGDKKVSFKTDFNSKKRKASESEDEKLKIYRIEDIPRTKKMQKIEKKKRLKKARKNDKIFTNLGDMLNNVNLESKDSSKLYDLKKDFNI